MKLPDHVAIVWGGLTRAECSRCGVKRFFGDEQLHPWWRRRYSPFASYSNFEIFAIEHMHTGATP